MATLREATVGPDRDGVTIFPWESPQSLFSWRDRLSCRCDAFTTESRHPHRHRLGEGKILFTPRQWLSRSHRVKEEHAHRIRALIVECGVHFCTRTRGLDCGPLALIVWLYGCVTV
jgi:hypothetical protein